jgi:hypothetical protein
MGAAEIESTPAAPLCRLGCKNRLLTTFSASIGYRSFGRKMASAASTAGL